MNRPTELVNCSVIFSPQHVAILDIDEIVGVPFQEELNKQHGVGKAKFYRVDVTNDEQLFAAFQSVVTEYGGIDVVVNNAAIMNDMPHIYKKEIAINVVSRFLKTVFCFLFAIVPLILSLILIDNI